MGRVRILGPRDRLDATLRALQDEGRVQLAEPLRPAGVDLLTEDPRAGRRRRQLERVLDDIEAGLSLLGRRTESTPPAADGQGPAAACAAWARLGRRTRREAQRIVAQRRDLDEERRLIARYRDFLTEILPAVRALATSPRLTAHVAVVPAAAHGIVEHLSSGLRSEFGDDFTLTLRPLDDGETALLLVLPKEFSRRLEARLTEARVPEVPLPLAYRDMPLEQAVPKMVERLRAIPDEITACSSQLESLRRQRVPSLQLAERVIRDWLAADDARRRCGFTKHAFELEGWLPQRYVDALRQHIAAKVGPEIVVEMMASEAWAATDAPVTLSNPRIFRPFERLVTVVPLPSYGTIDPTPFVAVFFPMFIGMMLGDVGYGLLLAAIGGFLLHGSAPGSLRRNVGEIALPCAAFTAIFGVLYGEYFGDLGHTVFGLHPLWMDREEAIVGALLAALGLGVVHVTLGLVLGAIGARRGHPRRVIGRAVSAVMVVLVVVALLAAFAVLPSRLLTPSVIALLVCFPIVVLAEGVLGTVELFEAFGNILSYARVMAIGTASVILAVVANRMVGAVGSTVVGLLFALLFHLVNFAIGLFSPAIHALRLHYVEFFGQFYAPGGHRYEPFAHWRPAGDASPVRRSIA
jgi:V/A-type H+-transporting ATPase subunit I